MITHCSKNQTLIFAIRHRNTSYQHHNFHATSANKLKSQLVQVLTCTDISLLWLWHTGSFKLHNKIMLGSSQSHHVLNKSITAQKVTYIEHVHNLYPNVLSSCNHTLN